MPFQVVMCFEFDRGIPTASMNGPDEDDSGAKPAVGFVQILVVDAEEKESAASLAKDFARESVDMEGRHSTGMHLRSCEVDQIERDAIPEDRNKVSESDRDMGIVFVSARIYFTDEEQPKWWEFWKRGRRRRV